MVALKDMISTPEILNKVDVNLKKKRNHEKYTVYEQVDIPSVKEKKELHFLETGAPSKAELKKLLIQDFALTTKTVKETQREKLKKALAYFDISDLLSNIEHFPNNSNNNTIYFSKKIGNALLKDFDLQEFYEILPNFDRKMIEEKVYMGLVTHVDEKSFTVCIGKSGKTDVNYVFSKEDVKKMPLIGDIQYVDLNQKLGSLSSRDAFDAPRREKLKAMNIEINGHKPIFYLPKGSKKTLKGKVISLANDMEGKEVIFQTQQGQKFSVSLETFKEGIQQARQEYVKQKDFSYKKSAPILIKRQHIKEKAVA